jgi:GNAT superfamily N-acetyltransferase
MFPPQSVAALGLAPSLCGFDARVLGPNDAPSVLELRENVLSDLPARDLYVREDDERGFVAAHLGPSGATIGLYEHDRMIAYAMLGLPAADDADNFGHLIGLDSAERGRMSHLASCMVLPSHRGRGLQRRLLNARLVLARAQGRSRCAGIVSLKNHASRHNLMREGLMVVWVGVWRGLERQLLLRELDRPRPAAIPALDWVSAEDFDAQSAQIGAGAIGVAERRDRANPAHTPWIGFAPR